MGKEEWARRAGSWCTGGLQLWSCATCLGHTLVGAGVERVPCVRAHRITCVPRPYRTRTARTAGLYSQLAKYNLPYPEAVFHISYFRNISAKPFYQLAKVGGCWQ